MRRKIYTPNLRTLDFYPWSSNSSTFSTIRSLYSCSRFVHPSSPTGAPPAPAAYACTASSGRHKSIGSDQRCVSRRELRKDYRLLSSLCPLPPSRPSLRPLSPSLATILHVSSEPSSPSRIGPRSRQTNGAFLVLQRDNIAFLHSCSTRGTRIPFSAASVYDSTDTSTGGRDG